MELKPYFSSVNECGQRSNNEDSIIHGELAEQKGYFFVICDGVGGVAKGEVASELACEKTKEYLQNNISDSYNQDYLYNMVDFIENEFDNYTNQYPETKGMATTMALLILHLGKAIIVHIGDSRVYHIRNDKILFSTQDHSLVNELVKSGVITKKEALTHPQRNVVTRALQGKHAKPVKADVHIIDRIENLDYFFLCSDGITESIPDIQLKEILSKKWYNKMKMNAIKEKCKELSKDNYSAFLVQILFQKTELKQEQLSKSKCYEFIIKNFKKHFLF
ncbi:MAG: protein phosphatase 2C domain-containing protein [Bacteroidales bacterium]|jgi:protein phosphatase|nr:protein phosphatase 2C domain-containing protein [Bacteroidales bacterium]